MGRGGANMNNLRNPAIRFAGFTEDWEERKLSDYLETSNEKNVADLYAKQDVLSVSGDVGIVNQIEFQGRSFAGASVSNYGIVNPGDVVYTKSPLSANPFGIIKTNKGKAGIVSTLYAVYLPKKNTYPDFIQDYFSQNARVNKYLHPLVNKGAKNDMKVSADNALKGFVWFPDYDEQKRISELFALLDQHITLHQREYDKTVNIKKALLEKMFPKDGENKPQIRFAGFTDAWEQRKLGDIANIVGGGTPNTNNSAYWNGDIDWYAPAEIGEQIFLTGSQKKITIAGLQKSSATLLPIGSVLFTSRAGIGNTAILTKQAATNQGFQSIVPNQKITDSYFIFSRADELKKYAKTVGADSTFTEVSGKQMARMQLLIPKIEEQIRIGSFFTNLDRLITLHKRELTKLQNIKKALLEKMFV